MYQLVIFDWDGTLMDSAQKIANCMRAAATDAGVEPPSIEAAKNIIGLGLAEAMDRLFPNESLEVRHRITEAYKYHFVYADNTEQSLFQGVEEGIQVLHDAGVFLAVATGKSRAGLERAFNKYDFTQYFSVSRCADETRSKPHPQMMEEILEFTSIEPSRSIMIGDTSFDIDMAVSAGMHGLGVGYGVHSEEVLFAAGAKAVLESFEKVVEWLLDDRVEPAFAN